MNRILMAAAVLFAANSVSAQIFECVDAKGRKEFAQTCPPGTAKQTQLSKGGAGGSTNTSPPQKSVAEREADFKKRNLERQEAEAKAGKEQADARIAERNCLDARSQLKSLQSGERVARIDPRTGERSYLEDKDRPAEIANAQKSVDSWCNRK